MAIVVGLRTGGTELGLQAASLAYDPTMLSYEALQMVHRHGDEWAPMETREHGDTVADLERTLMKGSHARVFWCPQCDEEVAVGLVRPPDPEIPTR